jgi:ABC-type phosphate/phosphonate transport system substrate-binding protein
MKKLIALVAILAVAVLVTGCVGSRTASGDASESLRLGALSTVELENRRAAITAQINAIEKDVELKAGLPMGVMIRDERGRLGDLYQEAKSIESELLRRAAYTRL